MKNFDRLIIVIFYFSWHVIYMGNNSNIVFLEKNNNKWSYVNMVVHINVGWKTYYSVSPEKIAIVLEDIILLCYLL